MKTYFCVTGRKTRKELLLRGAVLDHIDKFNHNQAKISISKDRVAICISFPTNPADDQGIGTITRKPGDS